MSSIKAKMKRAFERLAVRRSRLADVFYTFDGSFRDEHFGVMTGIEQHRGDLEARSGIGCIHDLRRRIHRLEKGLVARPRRDLFALDYITDTVIAHQELLAAGTIREDGSLSQWATGVFQEYFNVVGEHPTVEEARHRFDDTKTRRTTTLSTRTAPFVREIHQSVSYEQLLSLAHQRRSVRSYMNRPVPRALIEQAAAVAAEAPSACNRQPYQFLVYDDPKLIEDIGTIPAGARSFIKDAPCIVVVVGNLAAFPNAGDRHVIYVDAGLAVMGFELALETLDLASCSINWREVAQLNGRIAEAIGLAPYERVVMLVSVGYPACDVPVPGSCKKSVSELCTFNRTPAACRPSQALA